MSAFRLVPADPKHASLLLAWRQDADTKRFNPLSPLDEKGLKEMLQKCSSDFAEFEAGRTFYWFVADGDEIVGNVNVRDINRSMLTAEIGYGTAPRVRSRGVATAGLRMLVQKVFAETPLRKLYAYVHEGNLASRKVLERTGFREEGLLREHYLIDGEPVNEAFYGILRGELRS